MVWPQLPNAVVRLLIKSGVLVDGFGIKTLTANTSVGGFGLTVLGVCGDLIV